MFTWADSYSWLVLEDDLSSKNEEHQSRPYKLIKPLIRSQHSKGRQIGKSSGSQDSDSGSLEWSPGLQKGQHYEVELWGSKKTHPKNALRVDISVWCGVQKPRWQLDGSKELECSVFLYWHLEVTLIFTVQIGGYSVISGAPKSMNISWMTWCTWHTSCVRNKSLNVFL